MLPVSLLNSVERQLLNLGENCERKRSGPAFFISRDLAWLYMDIIELKGMT